MSVSTFTKSGTKASAPAKLNKDVFGVEVKNHDLLKTAYVAYLANDRQADARTLKRGEVSGGGKKPWKQKGTGRARFGSSRNPIWRGGGIAFGPTGNENYSHKLPTNSKRQALRQALSLSAQEDRIKVIETFETKDGKAKAAAAYLDKIGAEGNVLLVVSEKDALVDRATRNIMSVTAVQATYLNVFDILNADTIVISQKSLALIDEWLGERKPTVKPAVKADAKPAAKPRTPRARKPAVAKEAK